MKFFVPGETEADAEVVYEMLARRCGLDEIPPLGQRVYTISFVHDGVEYVARVGERRDATKWRRTRAGRPDTSRPPQRYGSGEIVVAIYEGNPSYVWQEFKASVWANPQLVGPRSVSQIEYFDE